MMNQLISPNFKNFILCGCFLIFLAACGNPPDKRRYDEIIIEKAGYAQTEKNPITPKNVEMWGNMPADDVHYGMMDQVSKEEAHALLTEQMPDDDIHAGFKNQPIDMQMAIQDPKIQQALANSVADTSLTWDVPEEWIALAGGGMRLATFKAKNTETPIECSVISLVGSGGGLNENILRWAGQLGIQVTDKQLQTFINDQQTFETPGGQSARIFDFTWLQKEAEPGQASMVASIIELPQVNVFIKMTGDISSVEANKAAFQQLVQSLKVE